MLDKYFSMPSEEVLTAEKLLNFINKHKILCNRYKELEKMYKGEHKILTEKNNIAEFKPNNKLVVNYAKYIVDTFVGFFIGIPVKTTSDSNQVNNYIQMLEAYNDIDDNNAELAKKCSIYGHAFELVYLDENAQVGVTYVEPTECFIIYDTSIRERPLYGIRYTTDKDKNIVGTISDNYKISYFKIDDEGNLIITDEKINFFGEVPIIEYVENEERQGAFENVETLINAYNKAISEKANDVDYFADAYLKILGVDLDETQITQIKNNRVINFPSYETENLIVEFMEKPNADQTQENLINRLEKLIFAISMVANINDENFGTSSGIALKYKLQSMSNLANTKARKFVKGFNRRYTLISNLPNTKISKEDLIKFRYQFTKNIPSNLLEEAQTANQLTGLVSDETILRTLSIVDNVSDELNKLKEQEQVDPYEFEENKVVPEVVAQQEGRTFNGAQIASLIRVIEEVFSQKIKYETAIKIIMKAFNMSEDEAIDLVGEKPTEKEIEEIGE